MVWFEIATMLPENDVPVLVSWHHLRHGFAVAVWDGEGWHSDSAVPIKRPEFWTRIDPPAPVRSTETNAEEAK